MTDGFIDEFLRVRDRGLSPTEAWRKRFNGGIIFIEQWFIRHYELLGPEDWRGIFLAAAASDAQYVNLHYRTRLTNQDDAIRLFIEYSATYLEPMRRSYALCRCSGSGFPFCGDGTGWINIKLYPLRDIPPEHHRLIRAEDAHEQLNALGCRQVEPPPPPTRN